MIWMVILLPLVAEPPNPVNVDIMLTWTDPNSPVMAVKKYNVYQNKSPNNNNFVLLGWTRNKYWSFPNTPPGYYRWKVTAVNMWGESPFSIETNTPPSKPISTTNLNYTISTNKP